MLIGPAGSVATLTPTYTWDSVPGATDYELFTLINGVASTISYAAAGANCSLGGVCVITPSTPLNNNDSVYWIVRGKNLAGKTTWSDSLSYVISLEQP
jgi:hypothetical protein